MSIWQTTFVHISFLCSTYHGAVKNIVVCFLLQGSTIRKRKMYEEFLTKVSILGKFDIFQPFYIIHCVCQFQRYLAHQVEERYGMHWKNLHFCCRQPMIDDWRTSFSTCLLHSTNTVSLSPILQWLKMDFRSKSKIYIFICTS